MNSVTAGRPCAHAEGATPSEHTCTALPNQEPTAMWPRVSALTARTGPEWLDTARQRTASRAWILTRFRSRIALTFLSPCRS